MLRGYLKTRKGSDFPSPVETEKSCEDHSMTSLSATNQTWSLINSKHMYKPFDTITFSYRNSLNGEYEDGTRNGFLR
jgi:hypothetical protein